ncbi:MAG: bifunctional 5,10-methylene-tetrahydrofolate dehydrogenase/5,10-methylene-tetrahydrofolate cyclohydrolase, partial [Clostridia bacterium]|nr:bifunctional 5,10-methylene-tetrahydrofolate dehydrogenase/5,10-methylene-tetrahydrofolate cyclohydrolase [Clostridia bacterium]
LLLQKNATVTVCHTKTVNVPAVCREAELVVAAVGEKELVRGDWLKPGAIVLDVGTNWDEEAGKLVGDVCFSEAEPICSAISPVPGGVGTMTSTVLLEHVVRAAERMQA